MNARELCGTELVMKQPSKGGWMRSSILPKQASWQRWETSFIPRTIFVACERPKDLRKRLVSRFTCCKTRNEHWFVDRSVVTVNTKRNYVSLGQRCLETVWSASRSSSDQIFCINWVKSFGQGHLCHQWGLFGNYDRLHFVSVGNAERVPPYTVDILSISILLIVNNIFLSIASD